MDWKIQDSKTIVVVKHHVYILVMTSMALIWLVISKQIMKCLLVVCTDTTVHLEMYHGSTVTVVKARKNEVPVPR